ncbi:hypothetical protein GCM10027291_35640 [Telluribacter humicola]
MSKKLDIETIGLLQRLSSDMTKGIKNVIGWLKVDIFNDVCRFLKSSLLDSPDNAGLILIYRFLFAFQTNLLALRRRYTG